MQRQFTATSYVLHENKVLLLYHPKLFKWLPPGGHLEANEIPPECAQREVFEETGLIIEFISDEHIHIQRWNAESFQRPFLCLLENIPPHKEQPPHQHIDFIYLARVTGGEITEKHLNLHSIKWFTLEETRSLQPDVDIFIETQLTIEKIFQLNPLSWHASNHVD